MNAETSSSPMPALRAENLAKRYGRTVALDSLSFEVKRGELFGLLGPNGAGKSTLMSLCMGLARPSAGTLEILGLPCSDALAIHRRAGALIEEPRFYPNLSARHNLKLLARPHGREAIRRIDPLLERVGLLDRAKAKAGAYSRGMKQRLGLAAAMLGDPELLILDEPSNGLDPEGADDFWALLRELVDGRGKTVVVSSHLLHEIEEHCSAAAILQKGRLVASGPVSELLLRAENAGPPRLRVAFAGRDIAGKAAAFAREGAWGEPSAVREGSVLAPGAWEWDIEPAEGKRWRPSELAQALADAGLPPEGLAAKRRTLRDLFRQLADDEPPPPLA